MGAKRSKVVVRTLIAIILLSLLTGGMGAALRAQSKPDQTRMNSLMVIAPYKHNGMWVFDDAAVGLNKEPFIAGIDTMIDKMTASIPNAQSGFRAVFSASAFPGYTEKLDWRREESGGNWYYSNHYKMEGWLCPALFKYFPQAPKEIYVRAEPKS
jgi:hypothetical protein